MERQAETENKSKLEMKEQRIGAERMSCFLMSGKKTSTFKPLKNELTSVQLGAYMNDCSKSEKVTSVSKVNPSLKNDRKRILKNSTSECPAKKQKFQCLLEFWGGGGPSSNELANIDRNNSTTEISFGPRLRRNPDY